MITVFTPTYNKAYIINKLYTSLCLQTCQDFEWLIVDDGSTDTTESLITSFIEEHKINIRYVKQLNGGKHRAINRGVQLAKGDLFFIVDSDDQLPPNSIETVLTYYTQIADESSFAGVCGLKYYFSGEKVGGDFAYEVLDCNAIDFRYKYNLTGDMAEVFKTSILREYPFPEFENEKFCPEALVWNRISSKYKLRYFNKNIYFCDYLPDGLTAKIVKIRMNSPLASMLHYSELSVMPIPFAQKLKAIINYWRFSFYAKNTFISKVRQIGVFALVMYPFGLLYHLKDLHL